MSRYKAPSTLSYRDRSAHQTSTFTPPISGRSSPYATNNASSSSLNDLSSSTGSLPRWQTQRTAEELESQNDERIDGISAKVKMLKNLTIGIGDEIRDSTVQLTQMNDAFAETSGILSGTFRRMNTMAKRQGGRWACYMIFMVLIFWFFVFVWMFRR